MTEEKLIYFEPGYVPKDLNVVKFTFPSPTGLGPWIDNDWMNAISSSDAGWSQFLTDYPDACPNCRASNGLDINRKCKYCEYDNSLKKCEKCGGGYFGESYTKPLCQVCYDKKQAKKRKAQEKRWAKQQKEAEERAERERLAWRAGVELNNKDEIEIDLDLWGDWEKSIASLTVEQAEDLRDKLERIVQDAKKKKSI